MYDVITLGELLIDFACISSDTDGYPTMAAHPGGAPANFLATINKCGFKTAMIGKVGNDTFGKLLIKTLDKSGIDTQGMVISDDFFTTLAFVTFDSTGDREFAFARKPGADTQIKFDEVNLSIIDDTKVFHFGTLSLTDEPARTTCMKAISYAKQKGKYITYDPNLRKPLWKSLDEAKKWIIWGLNEADIVKISDEEVEFCFGLNPEEGAKKIIDEYGVKLVFVTCGANGCVYRNKNASGKVDSLKNIHVIDTCGAGDIFGGSAVSKWLETGKEPEELNKDELENIVRFATAMAGISTTRSGGISSIPEVNEVKDIICKM